MYRLLFLLALLPLQSIAAATPDVVGTLRGTVTDREGRPIAAAQVVIQEAHRTVLTDRDGRYQIDQVPSGTWGVSFRAIGFRPVVARLAIGDSVVTFDIRLEPSAVELSPIQVTATPLATSASDSPQPLSVLQGAALRLANAASLGAVLEGQPGVRSVTTGQGIAKPVIRGLSGNRVLVLDNGQRLENQQWGDEHAPGISTATAERIEVVRGPASVLYGSDAIGGVINVVPHQLPEPVAGRTFARGRISAAAGSNGGEADGSLLFEGAGAGLGFRATAAARRSGDLDTPGGSLNNSGLDMASGSFATGLRRDWGSLTITANHRGERLEIHEDPTEEPDATPFQRVGTTRLALNADLSLGSARLEGDFGFERNKRREFESAEADGTDDIALQLLTRTWTGNVHLHHAASSKMAGIIGLQAISSDVGIGGEETLVPGSRNLGVAVYAFEQADLGRWQLSIGARHDWIELTNDASEALGLDAGSRDWSAFSGNAGVLYRLTEPVAVVVNLGRGFRAPSAYELYADGVHEGTVRHEKGDRTLSTETSFNVDLGLRVRSSMLSAEVGVYRNRLDNFIHTDPTAEVHPESGYLIYRTVQDDAVMKGVEAALEFHATRWLHLRLGGDLVHGENLRTGEPLPLMPPLRLSGSARIEGVPGERITMPYVEIAADHNARQTRVDADDISTPEHTVARLGAGAGLMLAGRPLQVDVQVRNLFDKQYRGFLSRYKRYADEAGRNFRLLISAPF